jgi:hypothetical protein
MTRRGPSASRPIDPATERHLDRWLAGYVSEDPEVQSQVKDAMLRCYVDNPAYWDDKGWPDLYQSSWLDFANQVFPGAREFSPEERAAYRRVTRGLFKNEPVSAGAGPSEEGWDWNAGDSSSYLQDRQAGLIQDGQSGFTSTGKSTGKPK